MLSSVGLTGCFNPDSPQESTGDSDGGSSSSDVETGEALGSEVSTGGDMPGSDSADPSGEAPTSDAEASCGDGVLQGGEECDLGPDNDDRGACTESCTLAICGDGNVQLGGEQCDDAGDSAVCDRDCTTVSCGDGLVNPLAQEQCEGDEAVGHSHCVSCVLLCDPGWSRCGGEPSSPCDSRIDGMASCESCGHTWRSVQLEATRHISIDELEGASPPLGMLEMSVFTGQKRTGWMGFELEGRDAPLFVDRATLRLNVTWVDGGPTLEVVVDESMSWPGDRARRDVTVSEPHVVDMGWRTFELDVETWDWAQAFTNRWANIGLEPDAPFDAWVHADGTETTLMAPTLEIVGCF